MPERIRVEDIPRDHALRLTVAHWSLAQWARDFPDDTIEWYLDLYEQAERSSALPAVFVAHLDGKLAGTASLVADDELPGATEPGPWVAAVFVTPPARRKGVGEALVRAAVNRAAELGIGEVYLYTETGVDWYEDLGWESVRVAELAGHPVNVMVHRTAVTTT